MVISLIMKDYYLKVVILKLKLCVNKDKFA